MKVDKVLLLAGSPSTTYTIAGTPKTFTGVVNFIIRSGDVDYNIEVLLEGSRRKPGLPWIPDISPMSKALYSHLCLGKADYSKSDTRTQVTSQEATEIHEVLMRVDRGEIEPENEFGKPIEQGIVREAVDFFKPRVLIAVGNYIEGDIPLVEGKVIEPIVAKEREIPSPPIS